MFERRTIHLGDIPVRVMGPYMPAWLRKQLGCQWPEHSLNAYKLKEREIPAIGYFFEGLKGRIAAVGWEAIAIVPSHNPEKTESGVRDLARKLVESDDLVDATAALVRHTKVEKLAAGGSRAMSIHLESIHIPDASLVEGRKVVLLDDITTTGNSLLAGRQLLLDAGAAAVALLALAKTTY